MEAGFLVVFPSRLILWLEHSKAGVGHAFHCSRQARNLNFSQGKLSQCLNAAKSFEDIKDIRTEQ